MEDQIRELLSAKSAEAPARFEAPPGLLRRARIRRATNAAATAIVAAGIAALGVAGVRALSTGTQVPPASGGVVPWIDATATPAADPATRPSAVLLARACTAADVTLAPVQLEGAAGSAAGNLTFRAQSRCTLALDRMTVELLDESDVGMRVVNEGHARTDGVVAEPGRDTPLFFIWRNWCGRPPASMSLKVDLNGGKAGAVRTTVSTVEPGAPPLTPPCNAPGKGSWLSVSAAGTDEPEMAKPLDGVAVEVQAPAEAPAGARLRYLVVLHNNTRHPIELDPCPVYTQILSGPGDPSTATHSTWRLNCAGAGGRIRPAGSVTFEMFLDLHSGAPPGISVLSWIVETGGPGTKVPIRIV